MNRLWKCRWDMYSAAIVRGGLTVDGIFTASWVIFYGCNTAIRGMYMSCLRMHCEGVVVGRIIFYPSALAWLGVMPHTATDYGHVDVYHHERVLHTYGVLLSSISVRNNSEPIKIGFLFPRELLPIQVSRLPCPTTNQPHTNTGPILLDENA